MQVSWERLRPDETDYEFALGVLFVPLYFIAVRVLVQLPPAWTPFCALRRATGIPCPTCGAYRSMCLLFSGRVAEAWLVQPLVVSVAVASLLFSVYSWIVVLGRLPRLRFRRLSRSGRRALFGAATLLVLLNWAYLIVTGA